MNTQLPWSKLNDFLLDCGSIHDPREFYSYIINSIDRLVPFDQARLYFINDNGVVYDEFLLGVDKYWTSLYHEYYSFVESGRYSLTRNIIDTESYLNKPNAKDKVRDWAAQKPDEFITNYIKPLGLRYSIGFHLHDIHNSVKSMFILDRTSNVRYTNEEMDAINIVTAHLENLHKNFYVEPPKEIGALNCLKSRLPLTARESEIAGLLMRGISPQSISKKLFISTTTVYKHIAHIHEKLHVSNRQELLLQLMNN